MATIKRSWIAIAVVVGGVLIGFLIVQHLLDADTYRSRIEAAMSDSLGRPVQLGRLSFSLLTGSLVAETPFISDDPAFSTQPFMTASDVHVGVQTLPLIFHRELHITGFTIDQPKITLLRAANGRWNYSSLGGQGKRKAPTAETNSIFPNLSVGKIEIKSGTVTVGSVPQQGAPHVYSDLNVTAQNFSFTAAFPFTVSGSLPEGGTLSVNGNGGPVNAQDASLTPINAQISLKHADLVASGLVEPEQGISGVADIDVKLVSNGQIANASGKLHVMQLKLAKNGSPSSQPVDLQFALDQNLQALSGKIDSATLQVGKATLTINGTYQTSGNTTTLQIQANGQNMPIDELVAFLPSLGVQLPSGARLQGGTLTTTLNVSGPTKAPTLSGPIRIANTQLAGFDLGQKLGAIQALTGAKTGSTTTIQALSTNLQYGPSGTRTDNLNAVVAGLGSASGSGSISPDGALNYQLLVKLNAGGVGGIATQAMSMLPGVFGAAVSQSTKNGIPVTIGGTTSNPTFVPNLGRMAGGAIQPKNAIPSDALGKALGGLLHK
jgi:AsmA protein